MSNAVSGRNGDFYRELLMNIKKITNQQSAFAGKIRRALNMKEKKDIEEIEEEMFEKNELIIDAVDEYVNKKADSESSLIKVNNIVNSMNAMIQGSTEFMSRLNEIYSLRVEIARINSETALKLAEMQKSFSEFITREENKKELLVRILDVLKEQNNKVLEKALAIDLSRCNEYEFKYVMDVMDKTQHHLDKIMNTFDKFITSR